MSDAEFSATRLERTHTAMQQFVETGDVAGVSPWSGGMVKSPGSARWVTATAKPSCP